MRTLIVVDNPAVVPQVTTGLAEAAEPEWLHVWTPQRALALLDDPDGEHGRFDLVVADNDTHPTGGLYLAREIKARQEVGRDMPPIVLLLARDDDKYLAAWSRADAFVRKPINPFDLAEVCEALAAGRPVPQLPHVGTPETVTTPSLDETPLEGQAPGGALSVAGGP